jgi:hypothetical protein
VTAPQTDNRKRRMPAAMIRDTNDGKNWSTLDKQDLADAKWVGSAIAPFAADLNRLS